MKTHKTTQTFVTITLAAVVVALAAGNAVLAQGIITPDPELPPDGVYLSAGDVHANYVGPDLDLLLEQPEHKPIADQAVREQIGADELEIFPSDLLGVVSGDTPLGPIGPTPVLLTGPVQVLTTGKWGNTTGTFDTEIIAMDLSGSVGPLPIIIRESPTQPSTGQTTITDLGGGLYHIDSFFDVFTELSVDGGSSWIPATGPVRMDLEPAEGPIPEPGSLALWLLGCAGLTRKRRRQ